MNHNDHLHLLGEKAALERMLAETPEEDILDRSSLLARLKMVEAKIVQTRSEAPEAAG